MWDIFEYLSSVLLWVETKKTEKKEEFFSFFPQRGTFERHHFFFILFFSRGNVLKFAIINVGGWKQNTQDAYIKTDLKPIKEAMICVTTTITVVVCWSVSEKPVVKIRTFERRTALVFFILFGWSDTSLLHPSSEKSLSEKKKSKKEFWTLGVFLGPGIKYPLINESTTLVSSLSAAAAAATCDAFAYLAEEEVTPPPRVVMILRDHPSKK